MAAMSSDPSTIQVRLLHFISIVFISVSVFVSAYGFFLMEYKDYSESPAVLDYIKTHDAKYPEAIIKHREMSDVIQIALLWAGCAAVCAVLSWASYYVIKGNVRFGDEEVYGKARTCFICSVLGPLLAAFVFHANLPYNWQITG